MHMRVANRGACITVPCLPSLQDAWALLLHAPLPLRPVGLLDALLLDGGQGAGILRAAHLFRLLVQINDLELLLLHWLKKNWTSPRQFITKLLDQQIFNSSFFPKIGLLFFQVKRSYR